MANGDSRNPQDTKTNNPILKTSRIAAGILFLLLVLGVLFYTNRDSFVSFNSKTSDNRDAQFSQQSEKTSTSPSQSPPATYEQIKEVIISQYSTFTLPEVAETAQIDPSDLPQVLIPLLPINTKDLKIEKLTYNGQASGYRTSFTLPASVADSYRHLYETLQTEGFALKAGLRTATTGFIEAETPNLKIRILQTSLDDSQNSVIIQTLAQ